MADSGEPIRQEDFLAFLKSYAPPHARAHEPDMIAGRYRILSTQPLPDLSSSYAKAYVARDEESPDTQIYALAFEEGAPIRQKNIQALKTYRHPSLVSLLAEGVTETGAAREPRYVAIIARPQGQPLAQILAARTDPLPEAAIINQYLRPLTEIVAALAKLGISHNRINPSNIYVLGNSVQLGECVSEPSGYSQEYIFEPVERMLTLPRAKADFAPGADCYALAMLALHLALGFAPFTRTDKETLIRSILSLGAYHTLIMPWDLPQGLQDLFRGTIGEGRRERWDIATLVTWLAGRRFNLVVPTPPRDTSRGFEFLGKMHFNRRSLAHMMAEHWKEARKLLADNRLVRWLKIHAHKPETSDAVTRLMPTGNDRTAMQVDEALSRTLMLLDPQGPLRYRHLSLAVESIGALLAHAYVAERQEDLRALTQILDADLPGFWIEQQKGTGTSEYAAFASKLQRSRNHLRAKGLGFGMERMLYDLNPGLSCLSPLLRGHHVSNLTEALVALDEEARQRSPEELNEAHLAAFLASRLDLSQEIRIHELHGLPRLTANGTLIMLKLMAQAQRKTSERELKGLANWFGLKLLPLLDGMHSKSRQRKLQGDIKAIAARGSLEGLADLFFQSRMLEGDMRDFQKAVADYAARKQQIDMLERTSGLVAYAGEKGRGVAQSLAFGICIATVYMTLKTYFNL